MDAEILARIQFGLTIAFHYIFPPMSIGLGMILVIMEGLYLKTGKELYHRMTHFWVMIFAIIFGVGVATGIVMEFQFGTNWSGYSRFVGDIFGSALAAEGIFAFFLESGFLGILVFGWNKVSKRMHFFATLMVWLGSCFSAIWIIVANSWQQTPSAYNIVETELGPRAQITGFGEMVFNPSTIDRLTHTVLGAFQTGAMLVASVSAYYLIKNRHLDFSKASMKIAVCIGFVMSILQLISGHISADHVAVNQPTKFAAYEGHIDSAEPIDLTLLGWYDAESKTVKGIKIPGLASNLLGPEKEAQFRERLEEMRAVSEAKEAPVYPPIQPVFQTFHLMVAIGIFLILLNTTAVILLRGGKLFETRWLLRLFVPAILLPHMANMLGWTAAEMGRMPWTVYGLQTVSEGVSPNVKAGEIMASMVMFGIMYLLLGALFIYLIDRKIKRGPETEETIIEETVIEAPVPGKEIR